VGEFIDILNDYVARRYRAKDEEPVEAGRA
jgi:hypothetical protein